MSILAKKKVHELNNTNASNNELRGRWFLDIKTGELAWSDSIYKIAGIPIGSKIFLERVLDLYVDKDKIEKYVLEAIEFGKEWNDLFIIKLPDLTEKEVRVSGKLIRDELSGSRIEGFISENLEQSEIATELQEVNKINYELNDILNQTSMVSRTDVNGVITYANDYFCKMSGYDHHELLGKTHVILNSSFHSDVFFEELWETILSGETWVGEIKNKSKDGRLYWVSASISPTFNKAKEIDGFISIRRDVTEQKKEIELSNKVNSLALVGESSAQMIHDVMNLLMVIEGNSNLIEMMIEDDEEQVEIDKITHHNNKIISSCEKIKSVFKEVKETVSGSDGYEANELVCLLRECFSNYELNFSDYNIDLQFQPEQECYLISNKVHLSRVFNNLIKNSIDAICELPERWIKVSLHSYQTTTIITFTDSGRGVPTDIQGQIFEPFFTTKDEDKGTGIGLNSCKRIIEAHGGAIEYNDDAINTQFIIKFDINY